MYGTSTLPQTTKVQALILYPKPRTSNPKSDTNEMSHELSPKSDMASSLHLPQPTWPQIAMPIPGLRRGIRLPARAGLDGLDPVPHGLIS
jgi:hypothetical protein